MTKRRLVMSAVVLMVLLVLGGSVVLVRATMFAPTTVTAYFASAGSVYPGDDVRVAGVKVGTVKSIVPDGAQAKFALSIDHGVPIPAAARAVVVAPNMISARYVQLAPAYETSGPKMVDGAVIPLDRTAIPVEWDSVKEQLSRLATELGPNAQVSTTSVSRFVDSAADAMAGNGAKLRETLKQLAAIARVFAAGSGDIVQTIEQLQLFVTTLRDSKQQIVQFQDGLASLTSVLDGSRSDLHGALTNLSEAVGEVQRFVAGTRGGAVEQVQRLAAVTQNLVDHRMDLEQVLHVAPTALVNTYDMFDPRTGTAAGQFVLNNFTDTNMLLCGMIAAVSDVTSPESAKLCSQYLGPALNQLNFNYLPIPFNPFQAGAPSWQEMVYSEARLEPGGQGPRPQAVPDQPPSVSAYTGLPGDTPGSDWPPAPGVSPPAPAPLAPSESPPVAPPANPTAPLPAERPSS
ncbi:MCE family protein [Mycolicibacterium vinylchloridicum]|uniref:MCE family protein n=1 Tax=Mycolicibacterium vinylchloridicum TaxID=2736928 RepID=UPI0015CB72C6|nr:MCE family protein [Mycolicibacterium vinylchloridicum]